MSQNTLINFHQENGIAVLTLNRPEKRNAMSDAMRAELVQLLEKLRSDRSVRALIVTGTGNGFCAGGDISGMKARMEADPAVVGFNGWERQQGVHYAASLLLNLPIPTIAAVNGAAAGLGADLALSCDFVVAARPATFTWAYIARGLIPDGGGLYFLPRRVGLARAKALIFSGRRVAAEEALELGIADRICEADDLLSSAMAMADEMSRGSRTATALTKSIINRSYEMAEHQVFAEGSKAQGICYTSQEHRASVQAFLDNAKEAGK
ncbi:enoyl-CoA hydratase/isomerase family protein [Ectopseudomonas guguanensis]|uniref:enoyl-CoA hydratase/isomerase family protein n=1 Tax=Ectopseudomonas guguanensis TaxID=1198456 RepID=UPI00285DD7B7|nr:enoyl-CoA hydratase/isomerase family protein [Pseudomonas guguanensis]MDR8017634.1 enoyl-CoA hydratase/isomerase family protein [Pseudomonas guguanensis]